MTDLRTRYLGMDLRSPVVASAGPLTGDFNGLRRLDDAGVGAVVLPSLFEEQITYEALDLHSMLESASFFNAEAMTFFPAMDEYNAGPATYLEYLEAAKAAVDVPVIASLNGSSDGGWVRYAKLIEAAGADAIELNVYYVAADPETTSEQVEARYLDLVASVRQAVGIPLAVKVGPYFSAMANMARRLVGAGANGLVLFNRFIQPDIDLESMSVVPALRLSTSDELRLPLRWIAILRGRVDASLAATTGVHSAEDALKLIMAGADVVMMTSALLHHGPEFASLVLDGIDVWLETQGYESVEQAKGSLSQVASPDPAAFERSNYMQALISYSSRFHA
jgi:dihydroorotate dehydrogenase (fumarate)